MPFYYLLLTYRDMLNHSMYKVIRSYIVSKSTVPYTSSKYKDVNFSGNIFFNADDLS